MTTVLFPPPPPQPGDDPTYTGPDYPGVYAQCRDELADALMAWDYSNAFHDGYSGHRGVEVITRWPDDRLDEMQAENHGMMSWPVISLALSHSADYFRSIGQISDSPPRPANGMKRVSTRVVLTILVSCWADRQLGGYEMVEVLGGHVQACVFLNQRKLPTFRHLRVHSTEPAYEEKTGFITADLNVEGDAVVSYIVPSDW